MRGDLPKPDHIVMSNTERERSSTFRYLDAVIQPALREIGLEVVVIPKSQFATVDLYSAKGDVLIPAFTTRTKTGEVAKLPTYCSNEWKRRVIMRWMRSQGVERAEMWLGISTDEADRMKDSDVGWLTHCYPLIDLLMSRNDCKRVVAEVGWPEAPKSTCKMCPHLSNATWLEMQQEDPADCAALVEWLCANDYKSAFGDALLKAIGIRDKFLGDRFPAEFHIADLLTSPLEARVLAACAALGISTEDE